MRSNAIPFGVAVVLCAVACRPNGPNADTREYIRLAVALGERNPDSIDFYYGPADWVADIGKNPPKLAAIGKSAASLASRVKNEQRLYRQLIAISSRASELLGSKLSFDAAAQEYFGLNLPASDNTEQLNKTRSEIMALLGGSPYATYDERFVIPPERLSVVMQRAVEACREETLKHLTLPRGEQVSIEYTGNKPWSGWSSYRGDFRSTIQVNNDFPLTPDRVLQLACHEGYPGHHVMNTLQDQEFVRKRHWFEWTVQPTFSPQSLVSEGMATYAVELAFPESERLRIEKEQLFPLAGLDLKEAERYERIERLVDRLHVAEPAIARDFIDGKLEWVRADTALEQQGLMAHPDDTLKYVSEYRTYMLTYTVGRDLVARYIESGSPSAAERWRRFGDLIVNPDAAAIITK